jgi:hypothetical protein
MKAHERNSSEFPGPAITVCSNLFAKSNCSVNFFNIFSKHHTGNVPSNLTKKQCSVLAANLHWCQPNFNGLVENVCSKWDVSNINVLDILYDSALPVNIQNDFFE